VQPVLIAVGRDPEAPERGGDAVDVVEALGPDAERDQPPGGAGDDPELPATVDAAEAVLG
jgi:hypothetical protein